MTVVGCPAVSICSAMAREHCSGFSFCSGKICSNFQYPIKIGGSDPQLY